MGGGLGGDAFQNFQGGDSDDSDDEIDLPEANENEHKAESSAVPLIEEINKAS
jgi:hypothetical protein